jgi:DnaJ-class molecular chaperone
VNGDPYKTLGVAKNASQADIQAAYRRLAKKLHPDLNPGNKGAEEQFKDVSAAYDLLADPDKRARFDRGEIDTSGAERPQHRYYRDFADADASAYANDGSFADLAGMDDILSELFGRRGRKGRTEFRVRGQDVHYRVELDFVDAVNGATRELTLPDGSVLNVTVPPGTRDGQVLRLRGKGRPGIGGGPPGDALVEVNVRPHRIFARKGDDIHIDLPISLSEAVIGGRIQVPTPSGPVTMTVPKWSNSGTVLRLKGKGVQRANGTRGDQYITLKIVLPDKPDPDLECFVADWKGKAYDPRRDLEL